MSKESRRVAGVSTAPSVGDRGIGQDRFDEAKPAAPREQPPSFLSRLFEQFAHPSGWLGGVAGLLMSRTANDDRWVVDLLDVQSTDRVLDVGCGPGVTLQLLAERAYEGFVAGVDPSEVMLRQAARRNRDAVKEGPVELRLASAAELPYPDGFFTKACAVHSIYFWPSLEAGLRELNRVLAPGGRLAIAVRMRHADASRLDPSRYGLSEEDLGAIVGALESSGFREMRIERKDGVDRQTMAAVIAHI